MHLTRRDISGIWLELHIWFDFYSWPSLDENKLIFVKNKAGNKWGLLWDDAKTEFIGTGREEISSQ